ncbi:MAG: hypothetical protein AB8F94_04930 [Saprospiraceae bacterium]
MEALSVISKALLAIHVFCGFSSIILFWIPIFLKKGSKNHILIGKIYVLLMWAVVISAGLLSVKNIIIGEFVMAAFLGFLAIITANPLWYGIAILKNKKGLSVSYQKKHMAFNALITLAGVLLFAYGIYLKGQGAGVLMLIFGILGMTSGRDVLASYQGKNEKTSWIEEHISGMLVSGIAAYTAFAVFGGRNFFMEYLTGYWSIIPWVAPTVIGITIIRYYKNTYLKKRSVTTNKF